MGHKRTFKKGAEVPVYLYYKEDKEFLGVAELVEFIEEGLTFYDMREEKLDEDMFTILGSEKWRVRFVTSDHYPPGFEKILHVKKVVYQGKDKDYISKHTNYQFNHSHLKEIHFNEQADKED